MELAGYVVACINELARLSPELEISVVRYAVNKEAPFQFSIDESISLYERNEHETKDLIKLVGKIQPNLIFCSGWSDKGYMATVKHFRKSIPAIVAFDNQWQNTLKQVVATLVAPFFLTNNFRYSWVPGEKQHQYAVKLGFDKERIFTGVYSADYPLFESVYNKTIAAKRTHFPKRFLYVGRYIAHKGIRDMWEAFIQLQEEQPNDWELWCIGTGELHDSAIQHPKIKHCGFVQPNDMEEYLAQTGVFILPSHFEPWGVVVHEMAAAGFPIISSHHVGANEAFVEDGNNGRIYESGSVQELKQAMMEMVNCSDEELIEKAEYSNKLAGTITPKSWSETVMKLLDSN